MSLIEKIDHQYEVQEKYHTDYSNGVKMGLTLARNYIISDQREPSATDINVGTKTIGDKIRESNESLAKFIMEIQDDVRNGQTWAGENECENYLNQPYTDK